MAPRESSFPTTRWTLILELQEESVERTRALEELCILYWYPIYAYLRHLGRRPEDAEDLTQAFFAILLKSDGLSRAEPVRGRLRSFLLGSLKRFLANEHRKTQAAKRGGGVPPLSLDHIVELADGEARYQLELVDSEDPERLFLRRWAQTLIESAQKMLREEYEARGNLSHFDTLQPYLFGNAGEARYQEPANELGVSVEAVRTAVKRLRQRFRETLRTQIRFTVDDAGEVDEEIRALFAALQPPA